jgi:hypothetical protein
MKTAALGVPSLSNPGQWVCMVLVHKGRENIGTVGRYMEKISKETVTKRQTRQGRRNTQKILPITTSYP